MDTTDTPRCIHKKHIHTLTHYHNWKSITQKYSTVTQVFKVDRGTGVPVLWEISGALWNALDIQGAKSKGGQFKALRARWQDFIPKHAAQSQTCISLLWVYDGEWTGNNFLKNQIRSGVKLTNTDSSQVNAFWILQSYRTNNVETKHLFLLGRMGRRNGRHLIRLQSDPFFYQKSLNATCYNFWWSTLNLQRQCHT